MSTIATGRGAKLWFTYMAVTPIVRDSGLAQRRSKRLALRVAVDVYGRTPDNFPFHGRTQTLSVNAFGGKIAMDSAVIPGQSILLVNSFTQEERECRVVCVAQTRRGMFRVGIEFTRAGDNFWHLYYPLLTIANSNGDA